MGIKQQGNWVPNDLAGDRKDTATLLVGTAREFGLTVRHHVATTQGGFYITNALADVLYDEDDEQDEVSGNETDTQTSGNRAAKNTGTEQE